MKLMSDAPYQVCERARLPKQHLPPLMPFPEREYRYFK